MGNIVKPRCGLKQPQPLLKGHYKIAERLSVLGNSPGLLFPFCTLDCWLSFQRAQMCPPACLHSGGPMAMSKRLIQGWIKSQARSLEKLLCWSRRASSVPFCEQGAYKGWFNAQKNKSVLFCQNRITLYVTAVLIESWALVRKKSGFRCKSTLWNWIQSGQKNINTAIMSKSTICL